MKVFISADIEGVSGTTSWDEATRSNPVYTQFQQQMTRETAAACDGALAAGATEILVKDAHGSGGNIIARDLPAPSKVVRGWSGHPFSMVQELDSSFDCVLFVGYHGRAGAAGNPLSHTLSSSKLHSIFINDRATSEFYIHYLAAGTVNVPVVMLSGDEVICAEVTDTDSNILVAPVKSGHGSSTINMHPDDAVDLIREVSERAVSKKQSVKPAILPDANVLKLVYKTQTNAYAMSHYPGARLLDPYTVEVEASDYYQLLTALQFLV
jgi:D-amino peptidase